MTQVFFCPTEITVGPGSLEQLPNLIPAQISRILLVMDPFFRGKEVEQRIRGLLPGRQIHSFSQVMPNPRDADIDSGADLCCQVGGELILALGGGSAIDTAKAINVVATNGGKSWDYTRGSGKTPRAVTKALLPLIAIPTTAGTGTEATRYSVITNAVTHAKATIKLDVLFPQKAIVDADLMATMPRRTTALTGIDAFAHAFEAYIGSKANDFSEMFSLQAMKLFVRSIRTACEDPANSHARNDMALCSTMGGLAISHSATTLPHGIGQALSGVTDAPHGGSIAVCMPEVIRWTLRESMEKFAQVACLFDPALQSQPTEVQANALPGILEDLFAQLLGTRLTMADFGLTADKVDAVADMALANYAGDISRHPRIANRQDLLDIIRKCL